MDTSLLRFAADVSLDPESAGRFRAVAYSGDVITDYGFHGDVAIDLATIKLSNPTPVLIDHDNSIRSTAGFADLAVEDGKLVAVGKLNAVTEAGKMVTALMKAGHPIQLSVGINADVRKTGGKPVHLNGRELNVEAVFENAAVRELSFVPVGADPRTSAHLFKPQEPPMPDNTQELDSLRAELAEEKARNEALTTEIADLRAKFAAKVKAEREAALSTFKLADAEKEVMFGMTDEQFAATLNLVKSLAAPVPEHLFHQTATDTTSAQPASDGPLTKAAKARYHA